MQTADRDSDELVTTTSGLDGSRPAELQVDVLFLIERRRVSGRQLGEIL